MDIALSVATSAWVHCVSQLSLLTLASFHCQLRVAEAEHLGWCDVQTFDGSLSTRYEEVSGIVNIRRIEGHAAKQRVLLECRGICQLFCTMRSSMPDRNLNTTIWPSTTSAPQEMACLFSLQNKSTVNSATSPCSHHVATGQGRGVYSVLRSGVEHRSFPHTVLPLKALPSPRIDVVQKHEHCRRRTRYERNHTGTDHVVLRRQRSRLGAASHVFSYFYHDNCYETSPVSHLVSLKTTAGTPRSSFHHNKRAHFRRSFHAAKTRPAIFSRATRSASPVNTTSIFLTLQTSLASRHDLHLSTPWVSLTSRHVVWWYTLPSAPRFGL